MDFIDIQVTDQKPKGVLRSSGKKKNSHRRGISLPCISFCGVNEDNNKSILPVIDEITKHEKAINLNKVGNDFFRTGNYMEAIQNYQEALKLFISVHGEEHKTVATTIGNIGNVYWKVGKLREAMTRLENSLRILRIVSMKNGRLEDISDETVEISNTLHSLGIVYYLLGNNDRALTTFTKALNSRKIVYGKKSVDVARTLDAIGSVYLQKGCNSDAIQHFQDALRIKQDLPSINNISLVISLKNLANATRMDKDYKKALCLHEKILMMQRSSSSSSLDPATSSSCFVDEDIGKTFHIIGDIYAQLKQYDNAIDCFMKAFERYKRSGFQGNDIIMAELKKSMLGCRN